MVESTCFQHTSSHPDKYNNSVDRIISKEEERRSKERFFNLSSSTVVFPQIIQELQDFFKYSVFYSVSTCNPATTSNSAYRINSSPRNTTTTRLIPCRPLPATVPRASKHSTRQKQHSKRQPASTHSLQQFPGQFYITEFYQEK